MTHLTALELQAITGYVRRKTKASRGYIPKLSRWKWHVATLVCLMHFNVVIQWSECWTRPRCREFDPVNVQDFSNGSGGFPDV